jgi:hypothetical protein
MDTSDFLNHLLDGEDGTLEEGPQPFELDRAQYQYKNVLQEIEAYYDSKRLRMILHDPLYEGENVEEEEFYGD